MRIYLQQDTLVIVPETPEEGIQIGELWGSLYDSGGILLSTNALHIKVGGTTYGEKIGQMLENING
jgi:hypothetical protein